jgi:hypothetical protein
MSDLIRKARAAFVETTIDDETVVMHIDSAEFFSLNSTAGSVWRLIDGERDFSGVVAAVAEEYGQKPEAIAGEVEGLLARLRELGFIEQA